MHPITLLGQAEVTPVKAAATAATAVHGTAERHFRVVAAQAAQADMPVTVVTVVLMAALVLRGVVAAAPVVVDMVAHLAITAEVVAA